ISRRLALLVLAFLAGCASSVPLQRGQIDALTRDTRPAEVEQILGKATPIAQTDVQVGERQYNARRYQLQTGSRQEMTMVCAPACFPVVYSVPVLVEYVVIQRLPGKELLAWGTPEELSKDADIEVSALMPTVKQRLEAAAAAASKKP
ncbi:MAG: hypothetical protein MUE35_08965, partial [Hydrogenophaga sp.]|nr:hypothetical protein [Hydrogenophaga sp.]